MGGAGVAYASGAESTFLNPAGVAMYNDINIAAAHRFGKSALGDLKQYNAIIVDSSEENMFKGSIAYRERIYEPSIGDVREKDFIANGAYLVHPDWAVGVRGYKKQTDIPLESIDQYNGDVGVLWTPQKQMAFGITQYGLFSTKEGIAQPLGVLPMTTIGGLYTFPDIAVVTADLSYAYNENQKNRFIHAFGVSFHNVEFFRTNVGIRADDRAGEMAYTAGFQFWAPRLKVGYAYQKEVRKELGEMHTIDISINL